MMRIKLIHPLWTHIPAILVWLAAILFTFLSKPLPTSAPIHFDINGQPDKYGSPLVSTFILLGIGLFYIILSMVLDELWARQEKRKTFNWMSLLDEATIGVLAATQITYVEMIISSNYVFRFPWAMVIVVSGLAIGLAIALERLRPFHYYEAGIRIEDISRVREEVYKIMQSGQPLAYWEVQSPLYSNVLAIVAPIFMTGAAVSVWTETPILSILIALIGISLTTLYGGFRTLVTRNAITVKMGVLGIKLLRLKVEDISSAEVHTYSPLREFGGYGIRFNKEMKAFFLKGNRGVKVITHTGKKYLIGSDHPESLSTVVSTVARVSL